MPLTLRPGTPADAPAPAIHRAALPGLARPWTGAETLARFAGEPRHHPVLALPGEGVPHLTVTPALHRRGIGATLLETAKAAAPAGLRLACRDATANAEGERDAILAWTPPPIITRKGESA